MTAIASSTIHELGMCSHVFPAQDLLFWSVLHLDWNLFIGMPGNRATKVDWIACHGIRGPNGSRMSRKGWSSSTDQSLAGGAPTTPVATNGDVGKSIILCKESECYASTWHHAPNIPRNMNMCVYQYDGQCHCVGLWMGWPNEVTLMLMMSPTVSQQLPAEARRAPPCPEPLTIAAGRPMQPC